MFKTGRILKIAILVILLAGLSSPVKPTEDLDTVKVAVLDLRCGNAVKDTLAVPLTNVIIDELVKAKKFKVYDRAHRDKILEEQGFQQSAHVDSEASAVQIGKLLGVNKIIVGSVDMVGKSYLITLQLIDVETGEVEATARETFSGMEEGLIRSVATAARELIGLPAGPGPGPRPAPSGGNEYSSITLRIVDRCDDNDPIKYKFFDVTNKRVYPGKDEYYYARTYNKASQSKLKCLTGAKICYGAKSKDSSWGVGLEKKKSECSNCCLTCKEGAEKQWGLTCN